MNIPEMTIDAYAIYKDWLNRPGSANEIDLINMAVAARDAQYAAMAGQEPVGYAVHDALRDMTKDGAFYGTNIVSKAEADEYMPDCVTPVYTHPAPTNPAAQERAEPVAPAVPRRWIVAKQVAADTGGPRPELAYQIFESVPAFDSFEDCAAAISEAGLPLGWVAIEADRLNLTPATPPAPAQPEWPRTDRAVCGAPDCWCPTKTPCLEGLPPAQPSPQNDPAWKALRPHEQQAVLEAAAQPSPNPSKPEQAEAPDPFAEQLKGIGENAIRLIVDIELGRNDSLKRGLVWEQFSAVYGELCKRPITNRERAWRCYRIALAPLPPASAAGGREAFEAAMLADGYGNDFQRGPYPDSQYLHQRDEDRFVGWSLARAALATKPQAEQEAAAHVPEIGLTMFTGHNRAFHETFTIHVDPDMPSDEVQFRQGERVLCRLILDGSARASNSGGAA